MNIKFLWHHSWFQGPYDGLAILTDSDKKVWFKREYDENVTVKREKVPELEAKYSMDDIMDAFDDDNDDEEKIDAIMEEFHKNYKIMEKYHQDNVMRKVSDYYIIYDLDELQLQLAEDYHKNYQNEIGYDRDHGVGIWKPVKFDEKNLFRKFESAFNPQSMCDDNKRIDKVHYSNIVNLMPPTEVE